MGCTYQPGVRVCDLLTVDSCDAFGRREYLLIADIESWMDLGLH